MSSIPQKNLSVFITYAHADNSDQDQSKCWLKRLMVHLKPFIMRELFSVWHDQQIEAGDNWQQEIQDGLARSGAAVLLVSQNFMASEFITNNELPILLKQASEKGLVVIPIILSASSIDLVKFKYPDPKIGPKEFSLADLQAVNALNKALESLPTWQQEEILLSVAKRLLKIVNPVTDRDLQDMTGAFEALPDFSKIQEVQNEVIRFRTDFKAASEQIEVLSAYKDLHDLLHNLRYQCYDPIITESKRFPDGVGVRGNFLTYSANLRNTKHAIKRIASQKGCSQFDTMWLQQDICNDPEAVKSFIANLVNLIQARKHRVILTIRSEFDQTVARPQNDGKRMAMPMEIYGAGRFLKKPCVIKLLAISKPSSSRQARLQVIKRKKRKRQLSDVWPD